MITKLTAIWLLAIAATGAVSSCADDDAAEPYAPPQAEEGSVSISFTIGAASTTRSGTRANTATSSRTSTNTRASEITQEAGEDTLHENTIERLDLFVFDSTADTLRKHVYCEYDGTNTSGYGTLTYSTQAEANGKCTGTWTETGLRYSQDLKPIETTTTGSDGTTTTTTSNPVAYLVANWNNEAADTIKTKEELKNSTIVATAAKGDTLTPNAKQTLFLMDGKAPDIKIKTDGEGNLTESTTNNTTTYTLPMELRRALAKIRLTVRVRKSNESTDYKDITTTDANYRLKNYGKNASVVAEEDIDISDTVRTDSTAGLIAGKDMLRQVNKNGNTAVVFYTYPNNWVKKFKDDGKTKLNEEDLKALMREGEPADIARQTYVLIHAPYPADSETKYWYKVPVNYRLQEDNDDPDADFDDTLYKTQRNYIYDITVTLDLAGGTHVEPALVRNVNYQALPWDDKQSEDIMFR